MKKISILLAVMMGVLLFPIGVFADGELLTLEELRAENGAITVEAYNIGQGFLVEPTLFQKDGSSTGDITVNLLTNIGVSFKGSTSYFSGFEFDDTIKAEYPSYLADYLYEFDDVGDGDGYLSEFDYCWAAGWCYTINDWWASFGAENSYPGSALIDYNTGEEVLLGDIIRWHFTVYGWGADCGFPSNVMAEYSGGNLFTQEDKSDLIFLLAALKDYYGKAEELYEGALAVAANPLATAEEIAEQEEILTSYIESLFSGSSAKTEIIGCDKENIYFTFSEEGVDIMVLFVEKEELNKIEVVPVTTQKTKGENKMSVPVPEEINPSAGDKIMLWENFETCRPLCGAYIVKGDFKMKRKFFSVLLLAILLFNLSVSFADGTLPDAENEYVENEDVLIGAEEDSVPNEEISNVDHLYIYETTGDYMESLGTPYVGSVGGEWMVICLTRSGRGCPEGYYENVVSYVEENINEKEQLHRSKSTDNSRVILALTSAGYDVTNVGGHNLLKGLSDMSYLKKQGVNGPIWALIALDSYRYEIPENENEENQATREDIIAYILEKQLPDGGWSIFGNVADPDMTGMAIQALAPYYEGNPDVETAIENALSCLSEIQHENGSFGSIDGSCSESCAQVIVALAAMGIDPETDERFIKNGISVVDALCIFAVEGGGFEHIPYTGLNGMATEQGYYALASYFRFTEGESFLYDMTDVDINMEEEEEIFVDYGVYEEVMEEDTEISSDEPETSSTAEQEEVKEEETEEIVTEPEITETIMFSEDTFEDVTKDDWCYEAVKYVYENNLMQGDGKEFEPESKMTRAMLITVLYRMENPQEEGMAHSFSDVPDDQWYSDAVAWGVAKGIVKGMSEDEFAPHEEITREQMALIIYRYANVKGIDVTETCSLSSFTDEREVSDWALNAMKWANAQSLINGTSDTLLSPKDTATRAQVAAILMRFSAKESENL